jgi:PAS domain S-box-containing protein
MARDRTRSKLKLLYEIGRELASSLDLRTVLGRVTLLSTEYVGAERGTIIVLDEQNLPLEAAIVVNHQLLAYTFHQLQAILEQGLAGWVLRQREAALVPDTSRDERWLHRPDDDAQRSGAKSAICVPLLVRSQIVGILTLVHPQPGFFNPEHLALLQTISDQAGIAVYNARLFTSLQAATRRYRELFEDNIEPILITAWDGQIIEVNRAAAYFTGADRNSLPGSSIFALHEPRWDLLGDSCENLKTGVTISYESRLKATGGKILPVEVYVDKVNLGDGESLQWIVRDISSRKDLDALREDLAAMIYHDLRSPLSNIISSLEMMGTILPVDSNPSLRSIFSIASRSTDRMNRLINSLLDINRLEAGQPITNRKAVAVGDLVQDALSAVQPLLDGKQQMIEVRIPEGIHSIWADGDISRRVLINILENAVKYSPARGRLWLNVVCEEQWMHFSVRDSGPGIPPEWRQKVFEKFIRLQDDRPMKGLGIGLAFCRLAVEAHGGKIWIEGAPEEGSIFNFTFPVSPRV